MPRYGKVGEQYFDDSGDPLVSGRLYFFEPGTTTPKDTYADVNQAILNTNPVLLSAAGRQPDIFFSGSAKVILTNSSFVQIEVRDPEGTGETENFSQYNPLIDYGRGTIVVASNGRFYRLFVTSSKGFEPSVTPTKWEEVEFVSVYNPSIDYAVNATVKSTDGLFYKSLVNPNTGNLPQSNPLSWGPIVDTTLPVLVTASTRSYAHTNFGGF